MNQHGCSRDEQLANNGRSFSWHYLLVGVAACILTVLVPVGNVSAQQDGVGNRPAAAVEECNDNSANSNDGVVLDSGGSKKVSRETAAPRKSNKIIFEIKGDSDAEFEEVKTFSKAPFAKLPNRFNGYQRFKLGFAKFTVENVENGGEVDVAITLCGWSTSNIGYKKYSNRQPGKQGNWHSFQGDMSVNEKSNATILTLTLTDGGHGDVDGQKNGTIVDPGGAEQLSGAPPPDKGLEGDADGDGDIDALDSRMCLQLAQGTNEGNSPQRNACDVDGSGDVTRADAEQIAKQAIGLSATGSPGLLALLAVLAIGLPRRIPCHTNRHRLRGLSFLMIGMAVALTSCSGFNLGLMPDTSSLTASVSPGQQTITLNAQNMPNGGIAALGANAGLTFNADAVEVTELQPATGWTILASRIDNSNGRLRFVAVNAQGGTTDGQILSIRFAPNSAFNGGRSVDLSWNETRLTLGDAINREITNAQLDTIP